MLIPTTAVEVIRREVVSHSSIRGGAVVRYCFIYPARTGAASAVRGRARRRPRSFETVAASWKFGPARHRLRVSMVWFLAAAPIGVALMIFRLVRSFLYDVHGPRTGRPVYEGPKLFD